MIITSGIRFLFNYMEDNRRDSTIIRHNDVHKANKEILAELGHKIYWGLSRTDIYERIQAKTGLSTRRIQYILNHTKPR